MINYRKINYDKIYPYYPKIYNKIQKILVQDNMRIIFQKTKKEFIEKKLTLGRPLIGKTWEPVSLPGIYHSQLIYTN